MRPRGEFLPFKGVMTALITPFRNEKVDFDALADLVDWQVGQGVQGLVACGATGESSTLSHSEWAEVIGLCVKVAAGRVPVIAGSGTSDTRRTIDLTNEAGRLGADAALVVTPYYNKPNQEGLFRHFESVERSTDLPIFLYNVPSRTAVDIGFDTLGRLAELPGIVGIKDATGEVARVGVTSSRFGERFIQLSGHDRSMLSFMAAGGDGAISVVSNVAPMPGVEMIDALRRSDLEEARRIHAHILPLLEVLELEPNPGPIKFALHCLRGYPPGVRSPMVEVTSATAIRVRDAVALLEALVGDMLRVDRRLPAQLSGK